MDDPDASLPEGRYIRRRDAWTVVVVTLVLMAPFGFVDNDTVRLSGVSLIALACLAALALLHRKGKARTRRLTR